ncbi:MAG: FtsX-like permease family protein, partial [Bacteroidota bacterium]
IADIHLQSNLIREMRPNGNATYVSIFLMVAYLIILMAGINFVNLATAQASRRAAQTGVRKILGAGYGQLVRQHLSESILTCLFAGGLAVGGVFLLQELLGQWFDLLNITQAVGDGLDWPILLSLILGTGVLAGLYPAFYLSRFSPVDALKGRQLTSISDRGLRNGLVVFQLVLSIALVAGSMIVYQQVNYFEEKELGFAKNNVLVIENDREIEERKDVFKDELLRHPNIVAAGFSNGLPAQPTYQMRNFRAEGSSFATGINWILADDSFLPTLDIKFVEGENFKVRSSLDSNAIILNESAVSLLKIEEPLGTVLIKNEGRDDEERLRIIGVVKDFHLQSLQQEIAPLAISFFRGHVFKDFISIRLGEEDMTGAIAHVEEQWKTFEPGVPLRYSFLDEDYNQLFRSETQLSKLFGVFTALAMFIAGLGLFGLITLMLGERTKEIGIRKVLGASVSQIVLLFSRQFVLLVIVAFLIATPLVWYGGQQWLQNFAYRIDVNLWPAVLALMASLLLTAMTVGWRSAYAARNNPVDALKNE